MGYGIPRNIRIYGLIHEYTGMITHVDGYIDVNHGGFRGTMVVYLHLV